MMQRVAVSSAITAACFLAVGGVATAAGPKQDLVPGTGQRFFPGPFGTFSSQFHVNAIGGRTHVRGGTLGRVDTPIGTVRIRSSVYCVTAVGNQAIIGVC